MPRCFKICDHFSAFSTDVPPQSGNCAPHFPTVFIGTYWVLGVGKVLGHNLLMHFSTLGNSKMEISETDFFTTDPYFTQS